MKARFLLDDSGNGLFQQTLAVLRNQPTEDSWYDGWHVVRHPVEQPAARHGRLRRVAVEGDGDFGLGQLHVREVDDVAPDQQRVRAVAEQIAGMAGCVAGSGTAWMPGRIASWQNGTGLSP